MPLFGGISAGIALLGLGLSAAQYSKAQKEKKKADAQLQQERMAAAKSAYKTPQAVKDQLADAQSRSGAVNPALQIAQQQAQQQQANQMGFAQRNASSGTQALSAAAEATQSTNSILPNLVQMQTAYDDRNRQELTAARGATMEDSRIMQQDAITRNQDNANYSLGRVGAAQNDKSQALNLGLSALGTAVSAYGSRNATNRNAYDPGFAQKVNDNYMNPTPLAPAASAMTVPTAATPTTLAATQMPQQYTPMQLAYLKRMGYYNPNSFGR